MDYLNGFGNYFSAEAELGALPLDQNSPQKPPLGLYAEQLSGSAFTVPRKNNLKSWLYRIHPSVMAGEFSLTARPNFPAAPQANPISPQAMRWDPMPLPQQPTDFLHGLTSFAGNAQASIHLYACNQSMHTQYFYNADGDFLWVPQLGDLCLKTEFGEMTLVPGEIAVIPRGVRFQVHLLTSEARGYLCENKGAPFVLPELGAIGANGLANPRDFQTPRPKYEYKSGDFQLIAKFQEQLWEAPLKHSVLDVVAWHGNYVPYKYDLHRFNTLNSVSFDHPDPSIFTVLHSPSDTLGVANIDFVIFPRRWMVAEHTFRPPYYHRNIMSEFMGLIYGAYDAKEEGFIPGGSSLHNSMTPHGPDSNAFTKATNARLSPELYDNSLAFMFESRHIWQPTSFAMSCPQRQRDYFQCWQNLPIQFKGVH